MDRIARSALDKLEAKRQAKRAIKTEYTAARKEADSWRARYKELSEARLHQSTSDKDLVGMQDRLSKAQAAETKLAERLAHAEQTIRENEAEFSSARENLRTGGAAFRRLQTLEPQVKQMEAEISRLRQLEQEAAPLRAAAGKARQLELEIVALKAAAAKDSQAALEVRAAKDKLRAATQEASAQASKVQACADMLARAEQVLKTCSQLHAAEEDSHGLAEALADTTDHIGKFLAKLEHDSASRHP
jgi:chromosome segregation ATPase